MILIIYHKFCNFITYLYTYILFKFLNIQKRKPCIFMFNVPEHSNMGDQAIVLAEKMFFKYFFPDYIYNEISDVQWQFCHEIIVNSVKNDDILCIHGGGYIGDLWPGAEKQARLIIETFNRYKIFIMPNTIFIHDSTKYREHLSFYDRNNVFMFLRDKKSYDIAIDSGLKNVELVPDTVTFMEGYSKGADGDSVLFCMRNDLEKVCDNRKLEIMMGILDKLGVKYKVTDTVNKHGVKMWNRKHFVEKKIKEFQNSTLVITDRLHGMYFSAITGTPCIAIDNVSKKVLGGTLWLNSKIVTFLKDFEEVTFTENLNSLMKKNKYNYSRNELMQFFQKEVEIIKEFRLSEKN